MSGVAFRAYGLLAGAAVAAARVTLLRAGGAERDERLGTAPPPCRAGRLLLHAVSAGEADAASALAFEVARRAPGLGIVMTAGTREGRAVAERLRGECPPVEAVSYLPWDRPAAVRRWLERLAPAAVVTVEAELWPGLFLGARSLGIPVAVASGRLRPGEARRYALVRPFFREVLAAAAWIGARGEEDRDRFIAIGADPARVEVTGDLKLDAPAPRVALPPGWGEALARGAPVVLAESTHAPEEELLLAACSRLGAGAPRLAIAARRGTRAAEIGRLARRAGLDAAPLSGPPSDAPVVVVDLFGLLPALRAHAAAVFLGGTVAPVGGHSPVGAASAGVPLVAGPSLDGVREAARVLRDAGALVPVPAGADPRPLADALARLLGDEEGRRARGRAGQEAIAALRGAAARTAARVLALAGRP